EWNRECQQLIRDHVEWCAAVLGTVLPLPCLFEDVEGCVPPNSYNKDDPYMVKYRAIAAAGLLSHGKQSGDVVGIFKATANVSSRR
ncbi:unnamed protein product, partial [Effrenium voratum]